MALDGGFIHNLVRELQSAVGAHIDKIHQPSKNELVLFLRDFSGVKRLLISCVPGSARLHFTQSKPSNPDTPPMFCMLMRKYFGNARITEISMDGLERVVKISVSSLNSMGDVIYPAIYAELIGAAPNIIAVNQDGTIIDAVRRSCLEGESRIIQPGAVYEPPEALRKLNPLECSADFLLNKVLEKENMPLYKALLNSISGISPLVCREIAFSCADADIPAGDITPEQKEHLKRQLMLLQSNIESGTPYLILNERNAPADICFMPVYQYGADKCRKYDSFCSLLDEFYSSAADAERTAKSAQDIHKLVSNLYARAEKRKNQRLLDLKKCEDREQLRIYGELLKANLYSISAGQTFAEVQNYYDEDLKEIRIPLNPALSPAQNAAKYFKDYKKALVANQLLSGLIEQDTAEIQYLESVLYSISSAENPDDIAGIREELCAAGYIKRQPFAKAKKGICAPLEFTSPSGFKVAVGKNNRQNDILTLKTAGKNDMWFHTKGIPGSHTVVFCGEKELTRQDILFAAELAASHSKAANSSGVPVDYTRIRYVKKPAGAKPGMVIYRENNTVFITPKKQL